MGRGRAKAKQQKVARELKYNTHFTDLDALQRELGVSQGRPAGPPVEADEESDEGENDYAPWAEDDWTGTER